MSQPCSDCHISVDMKENLDFIVHQFILMIKTADLSYCDCANCQRKLKDFGVPLKEKQSAGQQVTLEFEEDRNGSAGSLQLANFVTATIVQPTANGIAVDPQLLDEDTQLIKAEILEDEVVEGFRLLEENLAEETEAFEAAEFPLPSVSHPSRSALPVERSTRRRRTNPRCPHCRKTFASRETYSRHVIRHGPPKLKCPECGMGFYRKDSLDDHINTHSNGSAYVCEKCGKGYNNRNSFRWHRTYSCGGAPPPKRKKR